MVEHQDIVRLRQAHRRQCVDHALLKLFGRLDLWGVTGGVDFELERAATRRRIVGRLPARRIGARRGDIAIVDVEPQGRGHVGPVEADRHEIELRREQRCRILADIRRNIGYAGGQHRERNGRYQAIVCHGRAIGEGDPTLRRIDMTNLTVGADVGLVDQRLDEGAISAPFGVTHLLDVIEIGRVRGQRALQDLAKIRPPHPRADPVGPQLLRRNRPVFLGIGEWPAFGDRHPVLLDQPIAIIVDLARLVLRQPGD